MSIPAADVVQRARELWPALTEEVMPDTLGLAWVPFALGIAGASYDPNRTDAAAHALAHVMATHPTANPGPASSGALASLKTASLSASFHAFSAGSIGSDAVLELTWPGKALLQMRATVPDVMPMFFA